jgi:hypothetical protein
MKTKHTAKDGACREVAPEARERGCLRCDIPPFCRNNYYTGKLLTERDLHAEQRYLIDKLRLHHLALHGWGTVCGLKVKRHPHCPALRLVIEPGQAIDGCGREILVREEKQIELPKPPDPASEPPEPCPPEPEPVKPPTAQQAEQTGPAHQHRPAVAMEHGPSDDPYPHRPPQGNPDEACASPPEPCPPKTRCLYICLRYAECETEFTPAPFDECACNCNAQRPNRICETYKVELLDEEPENWERIRKARSECPLGDCADLYKTILEPCLKPGWPECIPLAVIRDYVPGNEVTDEMIDNWEYRPLLPSTRLLDQLIRCILDKLPTRELTHIIDTNWSHGREHKCHEFWTHFVGQQDSPKAFQVTFSAPVRVEGLSPRSFQALVVRQPKKGKEGGFMEVAPADVWASNDRKQFFLRLKPDYAECLRQDASFDLYLTLRCDVIVDDRGLAVDGDLLARLQGNDYHCDVPPDTGDGIPGGTFESWIRVVG